MFSAPRPASRTQAGRCPFSLIGGPGWSANSVHICPAVLCAPGPRQHLPTGGRGPEPAPTRLLPRGPDERLFRLPTPSCLCQAVGGRKKRPETCRAETVIT